MIKLNNTQIDGKLKFIDDYLNANNAADGSVFDPNSNVTTKNIATLSGEINKDINIQIKRQLIYREIEEMFGREIADKYIDQLNNHEIYTHDETNLAPYCVAVSMFPFLHNGLKGFGGDSKAPKHLSSYNGGFINLIFALSSQFSGAVATVEYLLAFDHFARKDYGDNYLEEHAKIIEQELQQVVYALNQPASARNYQSPFWNISIFDKYYFDSLFGNFFFPDGEKANWESLNKLQKFFMTWFNAERKKAILTFPVVTATLLNDGEDIKDKEYKEFVAKELSEGNSFFIYTSQSIDSLSSCCRLRNDVSDQLGDFSYSLGAGGVMTGSMNVITLNINRFVQNHKDGDIHEELKKQIKLMHKYQLAFKGLFKKFFEFGMLPSYDAGFINLDKQYLTIGVNGLVEAAEFLGYEASNNPEYKAFVRDIMKTISDTNKDTVKQHAGLKINTEMVPGENLGIKFAKWDLEDGYFSPRKCYNSYFYPVEREDVTALDKFVLHGEDTTKYLDGGSALHLNLEEIPTKETASKLLEVSAKTGCPYFCINVKCTICNECDYIDKRTLNHCSKCGSTNIDYATRVIGYLRRVTDYSEGRFIEESERYYHGK